MELGNTQPTSTAANSGNGGATSHINLSTPAGWALLYFFASVAIIGLLFLTV